MYVSFLGNAAPGIKGFYGTLFLFADTMHFFMLACDRTTYSKQTVLDHLRSILLS
jgi:hypothetical protein